MRKIIPVLALLTLSLTALGQRKLTPQALLKTAMVRKAAKAEARSSDYAMPVSSTFVVEMKRDCNASATFAQMKAKGATILSRLGLQSVVSLPIDSLEAFERIEGITRIDKGHKGRWNTDVTRKVTGVILLNGSLNTGESSTGEKFTGRGVTICLIDAGFDFQHPAFKDAEGRTRIKCVYMMGDNKGHKFTVRDPEAGSYTFPGSVYDTPELIATLTTDNPNEYHGTHTAGIAAGTLSPLDFGGMAPEADLVLIPLNEVEVEGYALADEGEYMELAIAFAAAYAQQHEQPTVLSVSANSHDGPHDGTSSLTHAIAAASESLIPVFSVGNEGSNPVHLHRTFTTAKPSVKTILIGMFEDESGEYNTLYKAYVEGYTRPHKELGTSQSDTVSVQLRLCSLNIFSGKLTTVWTSEKCTATLGSESELINVSSNDDKTLANYFQGDVLLQASDYGDGRLNVAAYIDGGMNSTYLFQLTVSGSDGTEIDLWDSVAGFGGVKTLGVSGNADGNSNYSAGDWTSTDRVISVGAYCANVMERNYSGQVNDTSKPGGNTPYTVNDIAWFSSYGTSFNDVSQPVVCAPGVNIVSSLNSHTLGDGETVADNMQWQGYPYTTESGTSMACPAVAGIVALWLECKPTMTLNDVKETLRNASTNDNYTDASPERWGYGKINAEKGIAYIKSFSGITTARYGKREHSHTVYDLQGRKVDSPTPRKGVYIVNKQGKVQVGVK